MGEEFPGCKADLGLDHAQGAVRNSDAMIILRAGSSSLDANTDLGSVGNLALRRRACLYQRQLKTFR